jgi:hypothetical protein
MSYVPASAGMTVARSLAGPAHRCHAAGTTEWVLQKGRKRVTLSDRFTPSPARTRHRSA